MKIRTNLGFWLIAGASLAFPQTQNPAVAHSGSAFDPSAAFVYDSSYGTLAEACAAAGSRTVLLSKVWTGLTTQALNCHITALEGGIIQPAAGQTVTFGMTFDGTMSKHLDASKQGKFALSHINNLPVEWFGALCDGKTDDFPALQADFDTGRGVDFAHASEACLTSATIRTGADGQLISGSGSGAHDSLLGASILRAAGSINGPVVAIVNPGVVIRSLAIDANGKATYGVVAGCAAYARIEDSQILNARSDNLLITLTTPPYSECRGRTGRSTNDFLYVANTTIRNSSGGHGIYFTGAAGDVDNNQILFVNDIVINNFKDGIVGKGSAGQIIGGNYSNNGSNPGTAQYYCIRLSEPGDTEGASNWVVTQPDTEACNYNTGTRAFRGPLIFFGPLSAANTLTSPGPAKQFCNTPGCAFYSTGSDVWHAVYPGGYTDVVGTGNGAIPNSSLYDHYLSMTHPIWEIQGPANGHRPIAYGLANPSGGIIQSDANGELTAITNTQTSVCPPWKTGGNYSMPQSCVHLPIDATSVGGTVSLSNNPLTGETHTLAVIGFRAGNSVTLDGNGKNINLASGSVPRAVNLFTAANQSLTIRYNGASWDVVGFYR